MPAKAVIFFKTKTAAFFVLFLFSVSAQSQSFKTLLDSGKAVYKREVNKSEPDFSIAREYLVKAVQTNPGSTEARYFLGYALDKMNAAYGEGMHLASKSLTVEASEHFEYIIKTESKYSGEILVLDPYSKISAIWGSLALSYLNQTKIDSARWAFAEGKRRGGYLNSVLEYNRQLLMSCKEKSVLITLGDNITFPIYYLQLMESHRTDVTPIDASLIHGVWYPKFLKRYHRLSLGYSDAAIDTLDYQKWQPAEIEIKNPNDTSVSLRWTLYPTYYENYLLKGDKILLDVLRHNYFHREIYFSTPTDSSFNLFLDPYLLKEGLAEKLISPSDELDDALEAPNSFHLYSIADVNGQEVQNSIDVVQLWNNVRWAYISKVNLFLSRRKTAEAKALFAEMERKFPQTKLPFLTELFKNYYNAVRNTVYK